MTTTPIRKATVAPTVEIGATGLYMSGGRVQDEFLRQLRGNRAWATYREMADNDAIIGGLLFSVDMTVREVGWRVEPATGDGVDEAEAEKWADLVRTSLDDMNVTWAQTVSAILSFLPFGWSYLETVYKKRDGSSPDGPESANDDGLIGWRKMALRVQESLLRWEMDEEGGLQGMVQHQAGGQAVLIPIERSLLFRTTAARSNPEGRSILRNAYRPWYFKKRIEEAEAIGVERDLVGLPFVGVPPDFLDDNATAAQKAVLESVKAMARDVKIDEQQGIIFPREIDPDTKMDLWEFKLVSSGGAKAFDTDVIIRRYDARISMTVMADFLLLGHEAVGSKALAQSKMDAFRNALTAWVDEIRDVMNDYAIPRLMQMNGVDRKFWPRMDHDGLADTDLTQLGDYVAKITASGVPMDESLDRWLRGEAGMPPPDEAAEGAPV